MMNDNANGFNHLLTTVYNYSSLAKKSHTMNVRFNLRDKKADSTTIILIVRHLQKRLKWSTGLHISPTHWDVIANRPITLRDTKANRLIKEQLSNISQMLDQFQEVAEKALFHAGCLEQSDFALLMNRATGKIEPNDKTPYLLAFIRQYCEENKRKSLKSTAVTLFNFINKSKLEQWNLLSCYGKGEDILINSIDWNFREKFYRYCLDIGFSLAYTHAKLKHLAQFINESRKRGHHSNSISIESGFVQVKQAPKQLPITLNINEINRLSSLKLSGLDEKVRDLFLIGLFTGQRFSDYSRIQPNHVNDGTVFFRQQKTGAIVKIRLNMFSGLTSKSLGDILLKYGNSSPTLCIGKNGSVIFNQLIKVLCRRAGITSKVERITTNGGKVKTEMVEKWRIVSSHTCRRSFATIWAKLGLPMSDIASATGHKTEKQLIEYIGLTHDDELKKRDKAVEAIKANLSKAI